VTIETIRYYEREGLVPKADRSSAGRRLYGNLDIARLRFIKRCRDLGFPIKDIAGLLEISTRDQSTCDAARHIASTHLTVVREKIKNLHQMESTLSELVDLCEDKNSDCPMLGAFLAD
jgi:MerR family mercuric resistance operon transcriptional regulator